MSPIPTRSFMSAIAALLLGVLSPVTSSAVVLFDGKATDYVSGNVSKIGASGSSSSASISATYSTTTAFIGSGGGYTGPSIYGGAYLTQTNSPAGTGLNTAAVVIRNDATNGDFLRFQGLINGGTRTSYTISVAFLFDSTAAGSSFDANSSFTLGANTTMNGTSEARWLVVSGGVTYVSSATLTVPTSNASFATTRTLSTPSSINWAVWSPGSDLSLGTLTYSVAGTALTNITRVGFYYSNLANTNAPNFDLGTFSATLATSNVPEPSATALLFGLAAVGLCTARRRRRA